MHACKPCRVRAADAVDGLLLATVQVYSPALVTVRVWVYCAITGSSNTVSVPSVTVTESLVQVTVVAGPPVEIQVRVFPDNVTPPDMMISPIQEIRQRQPLIALCTSRLAVEAGSEAHGL